MSVFETDFREEEREAVLGFQMLESALQEYQPTTLCEDFMEAFGSKTKKEETTNPPDKSMANAAAIEKGTSGLRKVIDAVLELARKIRRVIEDVIEKRKLDKEEKEAFEAFRLACEKDPSLKNKRITVKDFRKVQKEYMVLMNEIEKEIETVKRDESHPIDRMMKRGKDFLERSIKAIPAEMAAIGVTNAASVNRQGAKAIYNIVKSDEAILEAMRKGLGDKDYKEWERGMKSLGKVVSLKRLKLRISGRLYDDYVSGLMSPLTELKSLSKGVNLKNGTQRAMIHAAAKNPLITDVVKPVLKVGATGAVGGVKDKAKYLARKTVSRDPDHLDPRISPDSIIPKNTILDGFSFNPTFQPHGSKAYKLSKEERRKSKRARYAQSKTERKARKEARAANPE